MAELTGTLFLERAVLSEVVESPNTSKRYVVSGTSGAGAGNSPKTESVIHSGEFRRYGNGNVRLILGSSVTQQQMLVLRALRPSQIETVRALLGRTICYRDTYGRKIFGAFIEITQQAIPHSGYVTDDSLLSDIGLVVETVSYDEVV